MAKTMHTVPADEMRTGWNHFRGRSVDLIKTGVRTLRWKLKNSATLAESAHYGTKYTAAQKAAFLAIILLFNCLVTVWTEKIKNNNKTERKYHKMLRLVIQSS